MGVSQGLGVGEMASRLRTGWFVLARSYRELFASHYCAVIWLVKGATVRYTDSLLILLER